MMRVYDGIGKKIGMLAASLVLALLMAQTVLAAAVDRDLAWKVAGNYLEYVVQTFDRWPGADPSIASMTPVVHEGTKVFWHVEVSPSGYLLISSRDELSPVKLYSETGRFDPARVTVPGAPESWIIPEQFLSVVAVSDATRSEASQLDGTDVGRQIRQAWDLFGQSREWEALSRAAAHLPRTVGPLVAARWGQGDPYNRHTPLVEGEHTLVGCVATAWSMLLRHWEWPDRGRGVKTHTWQGQELTVDFGAQAWNWDVMSDVLTADSPQEAIEAVALLGYQVGVAAEMNWGLEASGSDLYADEVFHLFFRYRDGMRQLHRRDFSAEDWFGAFREEFDAPTPRPIAMSIFGDGGGHEILADGYQTGPTNMVHLNMGWYGNDNAWYDVTSDFATTHWNWEGMRSVIVTGIEPDRGWQTEIGLINPDRAQRLEGILRGLDGAGNVIWNRPVSLPAAGRLELDVAREAGEQAGAISSMRMEISAGKALGYQKFFKAGRYRAAVEALAGTGSGELFLPLVETGEQSWTGLGLMNTAQAARNLEFVFNDQQRRQRFLAASSHSAFVLDEILEPGADVSSARIQGAADVAGLVLMATEEELHGTSLSGATARDLVFPHVAQNAQWWTGYAIYNPGPQSAEVTLITYDAQGGLLGTDPDFARIPAGENLTGSADFPSEAAWFRMESTVPLAGYLAYGYTDETEAGGFSVADIAISEGVLPKLEQEGWTGIAFVNTSDGQNRVRLEARTDAGEILAETLLNMRAGEKWVGVAEELFPGMDPGTAGYVSFAADASIVGFQLNASARNTMLDALPALGAAAHVGETVLLFPHIAAE